MGCMLLQLLLPCLVLGLQAQALKRFPEDFESRVDLKGGVWHFQVWVDESNSVREVKVVDANRRLIQTLACDAGEPGVDLDFKDFNFDGYKDLMVMVTHGATGNFAYMIYLYDPKSRRFQLSDELSSLGNPEPDPSRRIISTHWNGGAAGCIHGFGQYQWKGGHLMEVRREIQDEHTKTTWERRNGELVKVRTEKSDCE